MRGLTAALVGLGLVLAPGASGADEVEKIERIEQPETPQTPETSAKPETSETPAKPAKPARKAPPAPPGEKPRGVCHFTKPGISLVVEDTTKEACHEREVQCQQDNPGHEAECRSRWTPSGEKAKPAKSGKKAETGKKAESAE